MNSREQLIFPFIIYTYGRKIFIYNDIALAGLSYYSVFNVL